MRSHLFFTMMLLSVVASAQTDNFSAAYESFKKQTQREYEDFRQRANAEYAEFLKKAWQEYKALPAVPKPKEKRVPPIIIKEEEKAVPIEDRPVVIEENITMPEPVPQPKPVAPIREQPKPEVEKLKFSLYGTAMEVRADDGMKFSLSGLDGKSIAKAWKILSSEDYNNLVRDCLGLRIQYNLCDWSYLRMLDTMSRTLLGESNEAELLKAFVFCQSGYQMRLATDGDRLHMLYGCQYSIYDKPCWKIDNTNYYVDGIQTDRLSICNAKYPYEQVLSLSVTQEQTFAVRQSRERVLASKDVEWMVATVAGDENLMAFCNDYPTSYCGDDFMTRWAIYANAPMSSAVRDKLYPQLREWMKDRSMAEAVDAVCHWIQTAFVYEYDDKVWGGDRAFFPDETLYYPYCDCEDRSILLTRIVRDLLGLKCALVYYPGHLATAIAVGEDVKGDYIRIDGVKFLVCDPTYIGAPIGRTMPGMDNTAAKVIVLTPRTTFK